MAESVSGQFFGERRAAGAAPAAGVADPRTVVPHAYAEKTADLG